MGKKLIRIIGWLLVAFGIIYELVTLGAWANGVAGTVEVIVRTAFAIVLILGGWKLTRIKRK